LSETGTVLRGRFVDVDLDAVVDWPVVRTWLYFGMFWLMITP
jgi:cytochrome c oxidase cbb3-type subunit 1